MSMIRRITFALAIGSVSAFAAHSQAPSYLPDTAVDLMRLIAPPPVPGSAANDAELAELHKLQSVRTPAQVEYAQADQTVSVFRFADSLDTAKFKEKALPATAALFQRVVASASALSEKAKKDFARPRPFATDTSLHPVLGRPTNASYPSGHSLCGNAMAIVLADLLPERRGTIFARGWLFAKQRPLGGVHYPSDIEAGRICAAVVVARLWQEPAFRADLEAARKELRLVYPAPK